MVDEVVAAGQRALSGGRWQQARTSFEEALGAQERADALEGLSWAAWWLEDVAACLDARERAYRHYRQAGDPRGAARMALWLGDDHLEFRGAPAVAAGWFRRAASLLEELEPCPEHGWLAVFEAHQALAGRDLDAAMTKAFSAREVGRRHGAIDLEMFGLATMGVVHLASGKVAEGLDCLDEAAAAALAEEYENLAPAAWTCCLLMSACEQIRDYERGAQWCERIEAFSRRLDARFVIGVCRAHYGVILTWRGDWEDAEQELVGALTELTERRPAWREEALVRLGELRRRQGRLGEAAELLTDAADHALAQRGLAAVALDRGDPDGARQLLERSLRQATPDDRATRADLLALLVRADLAVDDRSSATARVAELRSITPAVATTPLQAALCESEGRVAAAAADHEAARDHFEVAVRQYVQAGATVEAAGARLGLAETLAALGLRRAAVVEARRALVDLEVVDAWPERRRAADLLERLGEGPPAAPDDHGPLTARQVEVLRLVAEGLSDREIAARLVVSPHTVHRHVANIYTRLGCGTRAAAVAETSRRQLL